MVKYNRNYIYGAKPPQINGGIFMFGKSKEFVSPRAKSFGEKVGVWGCFAAVLLIVAVLITKIPWVGGICLMLMVVPFYINKIFTREVACILTGDKLTVEIIDYKQNRTPLGEGVFLENLEVCARIDDCAHNDALKATYQCVTDARTSQKSSGACFAAFERDSKRTLVYFEYNEMMIEEMKKYAAEKIFV